MADRAAGGPRPRLRAVVHPTLILPNSTARNCGAEHSPVLSNRLSKRVVANRIRCHCSGDPAGTVGGSSGSATPKISGLPCRSIPAAPSRGPGTETAAPASPAPPGAAGPEPRSERRRQGRAHARSSCLPGPPGARCEPPGT